MRIGGYARISYDDERDGLGVQRQATDIRKLVEGRGDTLAGMYTDNSVSAYKNVERPAFEQLLGDLASGLIDGLAVWDCDRLARRPKDLERVIDLFDARPLVFLTSQADIDLSTPDGRFMARLMVNFASKSSADMSRRIRRKKLEQAQLGKPSGGGKRGYGYEDDRLTVLPDEAKIIQEAAQRVLAGESLTSICHSLNQRCIATTSATPWRRNTLRGVLVAPRIAGLREYRGAVMMGDDGPVKAQWEPIVDVAIWEAVQEILTDPTRLNRSRDNKYLLSGFLRCPCSCKMFGVYIRGARKYRCHQDWGCGRTTRMAAPIDEHITELVLRYLEQQQVTVPEDVTENDDPVTQTITVAEKSLAALINEWNEGRMSDAVFFAAQAKKEASLAALRQQRAKGRRSHAPTGPAVRDLWANANLSQRRAILSEVLIGVKVLPKPNSAPKRFDPQYYEPIWREAD
jgi:site-specific DNA recombinase